MMMMMMKNILFVKGKADINAQSCESADFCN